MSNSTAAKQLTIASIVPIVGLIAIIALSIVMEWRQRFSIYMPDGGYTTTDNDLIVVMFACVFVAITLLLVIVCVLIVIYDRLDKRPFKGCIGLARLNRHMAIHSTILVTVAGVIAAVVWSERIGDLMFPAFSTIVIFIIVAIWVLSRAIYAIEKLGGEISLGTR